MPSGIAARWVSTSQPLYEIAYNQTAAAHTAPATRATGKRTTTRRVHGTSITAANMNNPASAHQATALLTLSGANPGPPG